MSEGNFTLGGGFWGLVAAVQTPGAPWLTITLNSQLSTLSHHRLLAAVRDQLAIAGRDQPAHHRKPLAGVFLSNQRRDLLPHRVHIRGHEVLSSQEAMSSPRRGGTRV